MPLDDTDRSPPITETDETTAMLIRARSLLERGWCRWTQARDGDGNPLEYDDKRAVRWCANSALLLAGMSELLTDHPALGRFKAATGGIHITLFNDAQETVEPVLAAFDRAIAGGQL